MGNAARRMSGSFKDGKTYWDAHYAGDSAEFDWYQQYGHLEVLLNSITNDSTVLVTGAGTSKVGVELSNRGVSNVTCIEQCQAAVSVMNKYSSQCKWECGSVAQMAYPNDNFDCVFDKAVLDAILCQDGGTRLSQAYLKQVARVMKPGGSFICISTGKSDIRKSYFDAHFDSVNTEPINKPSTSPDEDVNAPKHYVYVCKNPKGN